MVRRVLRWGVRWASGSLEEEEEEEERRGKRRMGLRMRLCIFE